MANNDKIQEKNDDNGRFLGKIWGKILNQSTIASTNGNYYTFEIKDIVNLRNFSEKSLASLIGCGVSFVADKNTAKEIFILKESIFANKISESMKVLESSKSLKSAKFSESTGLHGSDKNTEIKRIKFKLSLSFVFIICGLIDFIKNSHFSNFSSTFLTLSLIYYTLAIFDISRTSDSKTLFKYYLVVIATFIFSIVLNGNLFIICLFGLFVSQLLFMREFAHIIGQKSIIYLAYMLAALIIISMFIESEFIVTCGLFLLTFHIAISMKISGIRK